MVDEAHGGSAVMEQGGRLCHPQTFWHRDQAVCRDDGPLQVTAALGGISDDPAAHPVRIHACPHGAHLSGHTAARHVWRGHREPGTSQTAPDLGVKE